MWNCEKRFFFINLYNMKDPVLSKAIPIQKWRSRKVLPLNLILNDLIEMAVSLRGFNNEREQPCSSTVIVLIHAATTKGFIYLFIIYFCFMFYVFIQCEELIFISSPINLINLHFLLSEITNLCIFSIIRKMSRTDKISFFLIFF